MSKTSRVFCLLIFSLMMGCNESKHQPMQANLMDLTIMSDQAIDALAAQKVFFGHRSVGFNLLDGLKQLQQAEPRLQKLNLIEWQGKEMPTAPGIYHAPNGKNGAPDTKCEAFLQTLQTNQLGQAFDIAFFKFCYVDFSADSDVPAIFKNYVQTIDQVQQTFPNLKIMHVTTPLTVHAWGLKGSLRRLLKPDLDNVKRHEFNTLLRQKYQAQGLVFDLAQAEATLPDGTQATFQYEGNTYSALAKIYSSDGGHLNELGQKMAAQAWLKTLPRVALTMADSTTLPVKEEANE